MTYVAPLHRDVNRRRGRPPPGTDKNPRRSTPSLGALTRQLEERLIRAFSRVPAEERRQVAIDIHAEFDAFHGNRPDFRLWRLAMRPYYSLHRGELYPEGAEPPASWGHWTDAALAAAQSRNPIILWSMLALCPDLIRNNVSDMRVEAPIWAVVESARALLQGGLAPLTNARASCGVTAAMVLVRCQNIHQKAGRPLDEDGCTQFVGEFEKWLRLVDPAWTPGAEFDLTGFFAEHRSPERLMIGAENHQFTGFTNMLGVIRTTLSMAVNELSPQGSALLDTAYRFAMTSWLTARAHRIRAMEEDKVWGSNHRSWSRYERAFLEEFYCCLNASSAARDAGEYLESGKLLYLLSRLVPDEFRTLPAVVEELKNRSEIFRYLREVGLEPDPRFARPRAPEVSKDYISREGEERKRLWTGGDAARQPDAPRSRGQVAPAVQRENGFPLRLRKEQETFTYWHTLLTDIPPGPSETPVGYLLTIAKGLADNGLEATPRSRVAGFEVCLRYGYVRSAGKILDRMLHDGAIDLAPWMVMNFVRAISRCTALDPFGVRERWFVEWRNLVRDACDQLYRRLGQDWATARDRHLIHETLNNRFHAHHVGLSTENARRLFEKSVGAYDLQGLREFYDRYYDFSRRSPSLADTGKVASWLRRLGRPALGAPIAVSLVPMGSFVSILAISRDGEIAAEDCPAPNLRDDMAFLLKEAKFWFKTEGDNVSSIGWPASLRDLADACLRAARRCDPKASVFLLSMGNGLASLPWQHLMNRASGRKRRLVSIVPSLTAMTLDNRSETAPGLSLLLSEEPTPEIAQVVESVRKTMERHDLRRASVCVAVGHGVLPDGGGLPGLTMGDGQVVQSFEDWLSKGTSRVNIFHCCHSGVPAPLFMDEFGGLAGMAMYLGAKTFVAPVAEVLPAMAKTLQEALFSHPRNTIGSAYLTAIKAMPGCALYTLFGNPYEAIISRPKESPQRSWSRPKRNDRAPLWRGPKPPQTSAPPAMEA